uniref:VapB-type antitoxin n=1 Tax=Thermofilum pendens TaxID=2269 RepID=A0A7J3X7A7_THEPE
MKTIAVTEETWRKLKELKEKLDMRSFDDLINTLIETWNLSVIRDTAEKIKVSAEPYEIVSFFNQIRSGKREVHGGAH